MEGLKNYFLKEAKPFTSKREVNWSKVQTWAIALIASLVFGIMILPSPNPEQDVFYEKAQKGSLDRVKANESDPTQETIRQLQSSQVNMRQVHGSLDYLYRPSSSGSSAQTGGAATNRNASMILVRDGTDSRTQLPSGTRVTIRLTDSITVANLAMPVNGIISQDVTTDYGLAIPKGSKVLGDATFDEGNERAIINWRTIILTDGRERPFSAIAIGRNGQAGVEGKIHSQGFKNAVGQTLTRFIGAYAEGSITTGAFGANQGGHANGLRNAIAQTATDQANGLAEDLQKERRWIEVSNGTETTAILNQAFLFRDAGAVYGR